MYLIIILAVVGNMGQNYFIFLWSWSHASWSTCFVLKSQRGKPLKIIIWCQIFIMALHSIQVSAISCRQILHPWQICPGMPFTSSSHIAYVLISHYIQSKTQPRAKHQWLQRTRLATSKHDIPSGQQLCWRRPSNGTLVEGKAVDPILEAYVGQKAH